MTGRMISLFEIVNFCNWVLQNTQTHHTHTYTQYTHIHTHFVRNISALRQPNFIDNQEKQSRVVKMKHDFSHSFSDFGTKTQERSGPHSFKAALEETQICLGNVGEWSTEKEEKAKSLEKTPKEAS